MRAFLRQSTRTLPPGAQSGAASDWLNSFRAPMLAPGPLPASVPISPLRSLPLIAALQVSVGPTSLVALAHTWLALAAPLHMCAISTAVAAVPAAKATRSSTLEGQWWRECDGPPAPASAELASDAADAFVAWPPGWRDGSCASVGCLPVLLRGAGGTACSLDSLARRIRVAVAALGERHAAELCEQQASGRPVKQQARWKGKAAETAAAARVDVHLCWQAIADAVLTAPPSDLRAVGLVQLSTLPLQYLAGGCFEVLVPPVLSAGEGAPHEASASTERAKAAREASVAWLELLVGLTAAGCGVLLRGADIEMPLSCAGGGSLRGSVADVPTVTAWYVLVPEDAATESSNSVVPESAVQGLIYRLVTRDGMAGAAACTALGLRVHAPFCSDGVISSGGSPFAGTGLLPASKLSASAFSGVLTAPSSPASVAVDAMLKYLQIAGPLNPLDLSAGVGPGHRALVLRVELAAAFASAVVGAGLLDVLQPSVSGAVARSRTSKVGPSTIAPHPSGSVDGYDEDHDALHEVGQAGAPGGAVPPAARGAPSVKPRAAMAHEPPPAAAAVLAKLVRSRVQGGNSTGGRSPSPGALSAVPVAAARLGPSRAPRRPAEGRQRPDPTLVHAERTSIPDAFFDGADDRGDPDFHGSTCAPSRASVPSAIVDRGQASGRAAPSALASSGGTGPPRLLQPGSYASPDRAFECGSEDEDESSMLPDLDLPTLIKLYSSSIEGAAMDDTSAALAGASFSPFFAASTAAEADAHANDAMAAVVRPAAFPVADSYDASARDRGSDFRRGAGLKALIPCGPPPPHSRHNIDPAIAGLLGHAGSAQTLHGPRLQNFRYAPDLESEPEGLASGADSAGASEFDFYK